MFFCENLHVIWGGAWDFVTCSAYREACAGEGKNYIAFLRELLQFFAEAYEWDPQMKARLLLAFIYIRKAGKLFVGSCGDLLMTSFVIISLAGCDTNQDSYRRYPSREVESFCCTKPTFHLVKSVRNDLKLKTLLQVVFESFNTPSSSSRRGEYRCLQRYLQSLDDPSNDLTTMLQQVAEKD